MLQRNSIGNARETPPRFSLLRVLKAHPCGCFLADFLPFQCSGCDRTFCLQHRLPAVHACPDASSRSVLVCPLCKRGVELVAGEDPNVTFAHHEASECKKNLRIKAARNKRVCGAPGCSSRLTTMNVCHCSKCGGDYCMTHRFYDDHMCSGTPGAARRKPSGSASASGKRAAAEHGPRSIAGAAFLDGLAKRSTQGKGTASSTSVSKSGGGGSGRAGLAKKPVTRSRQDAAAELRATAARRRRGGEAPQSTPSSSDGRRRAPGREVCPQCGARFHEVEDLVAHVQGAHQDAAPREASAPSAAREDPAKRLGSAVCQHCSTRHADQAALEEHLRRNHGTLGHQEGCILS